MQCVEQAFSELQVAMRTVGALSDAQLLQSVWSTRRTSDFRVVVFGEFSSGKSTLINGLLGVGREVLARHLLPTTGHVTRVVHGEHEEVRVWNSDGSQESYALDQLHSLSTLQDGKAREGIEIIEVAVNSRFLQAGLVLIDTPGLNDCPELTSRAMEAIRQADLVLFMLNAKQLLTAQDRELIVGWLVHSLGKPVVPIVNFLNLLAEESELRDVTRFMDEWSGRHLKPLLSKAWLAVDAKSALLYTLGKGPWPTDDFALLSEWLTEYTRDGRFEVQRQSRINQMLHDAGQIRSRNAALLAALRAESTRRIETTRNEERQKLETVLTALDSAARQSQAHLRQQAQSVLDAKLEWLITYWYAGKGRQSLEANADGWYGARLQEATAEIDALGNAALEKLCVLVLAAVPVRSPSPMAVRERLILNSRIHIGTLESNSGDDAGVTASVIGAIVGQIVLPIPGLGAAVGGVAGFVLGKLLDRQEPDYVSAYAAQTHDLWSKAAVQVLGSAEAQFESRVGEIRRQLHCYMDNVRSSLPPSAELLQRERIENRLRDFVLQLENARDG